MMTGRGDHQGGGALLLVLTAGFTSLRPVEIGGRATSGLRCGFWNG